jgi:hypothetical protein
MIDTFCLCQRNKRNVKGGEQTPENEISKNLNFCVVAAAVGGRNLQSALKGYYFLPQGILL